MRALPLRNVHQMDLLCQLLVGGAVHIWYTLQAELFVQEMHISAGCARHEWLAEQS